MNLEMNFLGSRNKNILCIDVHFRPSTWVKKKKIKMKFPDYLKRSQLQIWKQNKVARKKKKKREKEN